MRLTIFGFGNLSNLISSNETIFNANYSLHQSYKIIDFISNQANVLWVILPLLFLLLGILALNFYKINSQFNQKDVENYMKPETFDKEYQLYFLFLVILLPIFEIIFEIY